MTHKETALRFVLYTSFVLVMLVSITHVAWCFHSMDHTDTSTWSWLLAYGCAIAIDIAIAAISLFLTSSKDILNKGTGYLFVVGLAGLSWFSNWLYAKQNMDLSGVWSGLVMGIQISWLAPILYGSLPILVIAFSMMIDHFSSQKMSAAELEALLKEKQTLNRVREQYKETGLTGIFRTAKNIKQQVVELVNDTPEQTTNQDDSLDEQHTDPVLNTVNSEHSEQTGNENVISINLKEQIENLVRTQPGIKNHEIVKMLHCTKSHVSTVRSQMAQQNKKKEVVNA